MDYAALFLVFFVGIVIFYGIIVIHDIPYEIAVHRNHPHQDALHVAGWVSLFTRMCFGHFYGFGQPYIVKIEAGASNIKPRVVIQN